MKSFLYFLCCFFTLAYGQERLIYVDEIKNLLHDNYVDLENSDRAVAFYDTVIEQLTMLPQQTLEPLTDYLQRLDAGTCDYHDDNDRAVRKKLTCKMFSSLVVKNKLLTNNLTVCNKATLENVTVNGALTINSPACLNVNCITTNNLTAQLITTQTLIASSIVGTYTGVITDALTSITAQYFSSPLYGDVIGTQTTTQVAFVCGVPACTLAQAYSPVLSATSSAVCGTLVLRDSNCNFAANTITANLTGTATYATTALLTVTAQYATTAAIALQALTSTSALYLTTNFYGDLVGTQTATQVALVCGLAACSVVQGVSTVLQGTSLDIPNTLVLRDQTGSFAATTVTVTGCITFTNSLANTIGQLCVDQNAMKLVPTLPRALQTTLDGAIRGASSIDLQMARSASTQVASGNYAAILSGSGNTASANFSLVGGGYSNSASGAGSVVMGGGTDGTIFAGNTASGLASVVGGGINNSATGNYAGILTGSGNLASGAFSVALGGVGNIASGPGSVICGGGFNGGSTPTNPSGPNIAAAAASFIGSGLNNSITSTASYSSIAGGVFNTIATPFSFIGGGLYNNILPGNAGYSTIGAGVGNQISASLATIVSGSANSVSGIGSGIVAGGYDGARVGGNSIAAAVSFIGAGLSNTILAAAPYSAIVSGSANSVAAPFCFIGGGLTNTISAGNSGYSVIGGGTVNTINAPLAGIVGGGSNLVTATGAVIGGGVNNSINSLGAYSGIISGSGNITSTPFSFIGGGAGNTIGAGNNGYSTIGGGAGNTINASFGAILGGNFNTVSGTGAVICGGGGTSAGNSTAGPGSFIGAGLSNSITNQGAYATIVSGSNNSISSPFSFIGAGQNNSIVGSIGYCAIGGGVNNSIKASYGAIFGGVSNTLTGTGAVICGGGYDAVTTAGNTAAGAVSFIGGGLNNSISAQSSYAAILSGTSNSILGASSYAVIAGGNSNSISNAPNSFAAGTNAIVTSTGAFVWSDTSAGTFSDNGLNTFNVRASGGSRFASNAAGNVGVQLSAGGTAWGVLSDVNLKTNLTPVDVVATLEQLVTVTTYLWSALSQDPSIVHIGPMAQDLYNAFGYGEDPAYINISDGLGLVMASVQGLYQLYQEQQSKNIQRSTPLTLETINKQELLIQDLEKRLMHLEAHTHKR